MNPPDTEKEETENKDKEDDHDDVPPNKESKSTADATQPGTSQRTTKSGRKSC